MFTYYLRVEHYATCQAVCNSCWCLKPYQADVMASLPSHRAERDEDVFCIFSSYISAFSRLE